MRDRIPPHAYFVVSAIFHYLGPAFAVLLFARVSVLGVAWLRIASAALIFALLRRPWRAFSRPVIVLGVVLAAMNVCFYEAIDRLPLGTVAAIEFAGVVAVAAAGARTVRNWAALTLAVPGVLLLTGVRWEAEPMGLAFAFANALLFAAYIVVAHRVSRGPGVDGLAAAMVVAALAVSPAGIVAAAPALLDPVAVAAGVGVGLCSSVIPYVSDQLAMERLPRATYALLVSLLPATATVVGLLVLGQAPSLREVVGVAFVVLGVALHREPPEEGDAAYLRPPMPADDLSDRALNRALLQRQGLLERRDIGPLEMIERLVGMQAQEPSDPYVALWSRIAGFEPAALSGLLERREAVRAQLIRPTIHLVSARDGLAWPPIAAPVLAATFQAPFGRKLAEAGVDAGQVAAAGRELLRGGPRTRAQLVAELAERWPGHDPAAIGNAVTFLNPVVQVPPRGLWGRRGQATWALTEDWLGAPLEPEPSIEPVVLRYLAAFGPAAPADMRTWSRLTGLREVFERLRPQLRTFRDKRGRELFDVPDGPLPDPDTPAPPRFLPEYDNVLLAHDDRSRILAGAGPGLPQRRGAWLGSLLADGVFRAFWTVDLDGDAAVLTIDRFTRRATDPPGTVDAVEAEAHALLGLVAPDAAGREVRFGDLS